MWKACCRAGFVIAALGGTPAHSWAEGQVRPAARESTALADATNALHAGTLDRARALASAYLKGHPDDPAARLLLARVAIAGGDLEGAYVELRRALQHDPRNVDALYYLGLVSGQLSQTAFERLQQTAPDSARVHQLLAEGLEAQDKREPAASEYEAALERQPDLLEALLGLARLRRIQLACDQAIPLYQRAERVHPTFDGAYGLGVCQSLVQDDDLARASFERAVTRDPQSALAWMSLGESLSKLRRPSDAIVKLQHAIALEPQLGEAYYALGMAYQATGQPALAQQAFKNAEKFGGAVGVNPDTPPREPPVPR